MGRQHDSKHLSHKVKKKSVGIAVFVMCLVLLLLGAVIGRYQHQIKTDNSARALEFYFTSNFLDGSTHTLAPGSTEVTFTLGNHADELRFSEVDIDYTVTVDNGATVTNDTGKLEKDSLKDKEVTISNLKAGTYKVTAVGTGGYSKTLTATIVVPAKKAQIYQHLDNVPGEYILLTVWNEGDESGNVTIEYDGIPDNTNPNMTDWKINENHEIEIKPHESKVFRFFSGSATVTGNVEDKEPY